MYWSQNNAERGGIAVITTEAVDISTIIGTLNAKTIYTWLSNKPITSMLKRKGEGEN
jgi:hypothetical protein